MKRHYAAVCLSLKTRGGKKKKKINLFFTFYEGEILNNSPDTCDLTSDLLRHL